MSPEKSASTQVEMDFAGAVKAILEQKKVTRLAWNSSDCIFLHADILHLRKDDGTLHKLIVSEGDLSAADWVVVREQ